jgi:hypothetical protein
MGRGKHRDKQVNLEKVQSKNIGKKDCLADYGWAAEQQSTRKSKKGPTPTLSYALL